MGGTKFRVSQSFGKRKRSTKARGSSTGRPRKVEAVVTPETTASTTNTTTTTAEVGIMSVK